MSPSVNQELYNAGLFNKWNFKWKKIIIKIRMTDTNRNVVSARHNPVKPSWDVYRLDKCSYRVFPISNIKAEIIAC